ncbi:MAG: TraB/GumN family protein [Candidatus Aenigmatarchaeota archaeon]
MAKVSIVGTSHIAPASIDAAKETILRLRPDCVALELDAERWAALHQRQRAKPSIRNPMFWLLNSIQTSLGAHTGVLPGAEMLAAVDAAKQVGAQIVLIDMPIAETMGRLSAIGFWEKARLVLRLLAGLVPWPGREEIDLKNVPPEKVIDDALRWMKKELPALYKVMITDRNVYMVHWIRELGRKHERIVVVVGAGHKLGLERLLRNKSSKRAKKGRA